MRSVSSIARSGRSAQPDAQQRSVGVGKDLGAHARQQNVEQSDRRRQIDRAPAASGNAAPARDTVDKRAQAAEESLPLFAAMCFSHQPGREHRDQAARQQVGRDHRERHGQRQRNEKLAAHADHEERRNEHGEDAEHREQARHGGAAAGFDDGAGARDAGQHLRVDVLDRDRRLVHQNADRERQTAERHDVDRLAGGPQQDHRAQQGERNVHDDDQRAAPVAQEDQHHQAGEHRAEQSFRHQAADRVA